MKFIKSLCKTIAIIITFVVIASIAINVYVIASSRKYIMDAADAAALNADCILVLGARVWSGGTLSAMLADRVWTGVELYKAGASDRMLMSGDHGQTEYDEVNYMKRYAVERGVPPEDVFMDHAGFSTYESMYRADYIFQAKKIVVVTQKYHLHRAVYVARALGIEAYGVSATLRPYSSDVYNEAREYLARIKDFFTVILRPEPTYLGEAIPIWGENLTDG